ncbi:uncharacterized protein LOC113563387 [Ooceraea biroi]|uniref:uncharacterized protein LOC113563265 n=1 Tax=Ooceraea biroi TaxID=2015173 RepID=UPI000F07321F|nr:uncharacterized protein LOC113563265 [Ooceraea biroi]XP_026830768.1 uncharacterized protein LOC113563387 [Ooceraea biroi]
MSKAINYVLMFTILEIYIAIGLIFFLPSYTDVNTKIIRAIVFTVSGCFLSLFLLGMYHHYQNGNHRKNSRRIVRRQSSLDDAIAVREIHTIDYMIPNRHAKKNNDEQDKSTWHPRRRTLD